MSLKCNCPGVSFKPKLLARKLCGQIDINLCTTLAGVPPESWEYRLGTYSALERVLERYKEKKPKAPTIAEKFNTYQLANYKEQVIELLMRVYGKRRDNENNKRDARVIKNALMKKGRFSL